MNNVVSQRFKNQSHQPNITPIPVAPNHTEPTQTVDNSPPVNSDALREKLTEKLNPQPIVVEAVPTAIPNPVRLELVHFASLHEFVHWYKNNKTLFSEAQHKPLDTLIEASKITEAGCNCDKHKRKSMADDYFKNFWIRNSKTDLLPTLQKILNTKKLLIGNFISFPQ